MTWYIQGKMMDKEIHEECGVFGVHKVDNSAHCAYYGLHSLQHRGQESAGIASSNGMRIQTYRTTVRYRSFYERAHSGIKRHQAIGHIRYSNHHENIIENVQPIMVRSHQGDFAIVTNGQIVNARELRYDLETRGSIFQGTSDAELISHLIQRAEELFLIKLPRRVSDWMVRFPWLL